MKFKRILLVFLMAMLAFVVVACNSSNDDNKPDDETPVVKTYTVVFMNEGERHATAKVKEGEKITATIANPVKEGYSFVGWFEGETEIVLADYTVTKDVTFEAHFVNDEIDNSLDVEAVKEEGKTYTLVIGWWEVNDPDDPDKKTSYLTKELVQKFYSNVNLYLKVKGLTDEQIANVQVRNYSTKAVADMGALVNADGDVDIMIGVGNNINSTAGVSLYESSNDNKFATLMGTTPTSRYVALTSYATELGVNVWDWLYTEVGRTAFNTVLEEADIVIAAPRTSEANVDVHVYNADASSYETLHFATKDDVLTLPEIAVADGLAFKGFATSNGGEVALVKANGAELKYNDIKDLLGESTSLDLYPVFAEIPVVSEDLIVYVQINGSNLTLPEAKLLEARFNASLSEAKVVKFVFVEGNADAFTTEFNAASAVDVVIGGNNPLKNYAAHTDGPLANAGAKHFASTNRKVIICANTQHSELAKALYDFVLADAPDYEVHATFWLNNNTWITEEELAAIKEGIPAFVKAQFGLTETELADVYGITLTTYDATGTKVAALGDETRALRDGKGTDLIIGCGGNVTSTGGFTDAVVADIPTSIVANSRKVALVSDNAIAKMIFEGFFVVAE